jgi:hypothetical protein
MRRDRGRHEEFCAVSGEFGDLIAFAGSLW